MAKQFCWFESGLTVACELTRSWLIQDGFSKSGTITAFMVSPLLAVNTVCTSKCLFEDSGNSKTGTNATSTTLLIKQNLWGMSEVGLWFLYLKRWSYRVLLQRVRMQWEVWKIETILANNLSGLPWSLPGSTQSLFRAQPRTSLIVSLRL